MRTANRPKHKKSPLRWLRRGVVVTVFLAAASWPFWAGTLGLAQLAAPSGGDGATADTGPRAAKAILDEFEKAATPGKFHDLLKPLVGTFAATATYAPGPAAAGDTGDAPTSQGVSTNTMILGGRFLRQDYAGRLGDREFHALTLTGYDNVTAGYQAVTCDEFETALLTMDGAVDDTGKIFTFSGQAGDPISGQVKSFRRVLRVESDKRHVLEMYEPDAGGQLRKSVSIVYDRVADAPATQPGGD